MTQQPPLARARLAARLRALRLNTWPGQPVTQRQVAEALSVSEPSVSSWEKPDSRAVPSGDRLEAYARFFATRGSVTSDPARLIDAQDLTADEELRRQQVLDELVALRDETSWEAVSADSSAPRSFFHFPDGQPIRIVCSSLPHYEIGSQYASKWHPNYIASLHNADMDAAIELYGHIRALNPESDVRWLTLDQVNPKVFASHVVILGGASMGGSPDATGALEYYIKRLELPVSMTLPQGGDDEYDSVWRISTDEHGVPMYKGPAAVDFPATFVTDDANGRRLLRGGPRTLADWPRERSLAPPQDGPTTFVRPGEPQLEYDVALLARMPNVLQLSATVTICSGLFSRGTYGIVRALTDPQRVGPNEAYLRAFERPDNFWLLTYVPVFAGPDGLETLAPDLNRPFHVQLSSERFDQHSPALP
jgi:transcriptional regulator with XRE-family HTH domain